MTKVLPVQIRVLIYQGLLFILPIVIFITVGIYLPFVLHRFGISAGGQALLPLYLVSLMGGLYQGAVSGLLIGLAGPAISFMISGMPVVAILPYVVFKAILTGSISGFLVEKYAKLGLYRISIITIIFTQSAGILMILFLSGNRNLALSDIFLGYPGLLIQMVVAPGIINLMKKMRIKLLP